jgi:hypothetical protein
VYFKSIKSNVKISICKVKKRLNFFALSSFMHSFCWNVARMDIALENLKESWRALIFVLNCSIGWDIVLIENIRKQLQLLNFSFAFYHELWHFAVFCLLVGLMFEFILCLLFADWKIVERVRPRSWA